MKIFYLMLITELVIGSVLVHAGSQTGSSITQQGSRSGTTLKKHVRIPDSPLTLSQAIKIAVKNNPRIAALRWDSAAAQARKEQISGLQLPRIGIRSSISHHINRQRLIPVTGNGKSGMFSRNIVSGDVFVSLPLFTGGRIVNSIKVAELLKKAAEQHLSRNREELIFNISSTFNTILAQKQLIRSLKFSHKTLKEHMSRVDALVKARKAAEVDRMRTGVRLADIEQQLVRENNLLSIQYRVMKNLLGIKKPDAHLALTGNLEEKSLKPLPSLTQATSIAYKRRNDYLALHSRLAAQRKKVQIARSGHFPQLSLQSSYGWRQAIGNTSGTGDKGKDTGGIGLSLELPVFEGGRINAAVKEQKALLEALKERLLSLELQITLEVETAILNVHSFKNRATAIRKSIELARESLRIEKQKYNLSKGAIIDVLEAQASLLKSETTYYRVLAEYQIALAQLKLAMGEQ